MRTFLEALINRKEFEEKEISVEDALRMLEAFMERIPRKIDRKNMPQIPELNLLTGRLDRFIKKHNLPVTNEELDVNNLLPSQDINYNKVKNIIENGGKNKPLFVARGGDNINRIVDGHHHWAALWCKDKMFPDRPEAPWHHIPCLVFHGEFPNVVRSLNQFSDDVKSSPDTVADLTLRKELLDNQGKEVFASVNDDLLNWLGQENKPQEENKPQQVTPPAEKPAIPQKTSRFQRTFVRKKMNFPSSIFETSFRHWLMFRTQNQKQV